MRIWIGLAIAASITLAATYVFARPLWHPLVVSVVGGRTVLDVVEQLGDEALSRLRSRFEEAGVQYPPAQITLLGLKAEKQLELWVHSSRGSTKVATYPIKAASGVAGPKLREGDRQVPEGVYKITGLNPNSSYHLSMKLNFPNAFDQLHAGREGRTQPGSDIFIHGRAVSVGCLAMGDPAIEELFILIAKTGVENARVIIAPHDPAGLALLPAPAHLPHWTADLYAQIETQLAIDGLR